MTVQPNQANKRASTTSIPLIAELPFERTTALAIGALIIAVLVLITLIGLLTLLPAQTISQVVNEQVTERQRALAGALARQTESYLSDVAYDLVGLTNRSEIKAPDLSVRQTAIDLLREVAVRRPGQIKSIVRYYNDGTPIYAWPDEYNRKVLDQRPLPWVVDSAWINQIVQNRVVQFVQIKQTDGTSTYLLATPVGQGFNVSEVLVIEVDLGNYFLSTLRETKLGETGQVWIFDQDNALVYQFNRQPDFKTDISKVDVQSQPVVLTGYPTADRESVVAPVFGALARDRLGQRSLTLVLSHATSEGTEAVFATLRSLFVFGLVAILVIVTFGVLIGRFLLRESLRAQRESQRRATARMLLSTSRALNSSLDLSIVLGRILDELQSILPHDAATILLLDEDKDSVIYAAGRGDEGTPVPVDGTPALLSGLRATAAVVSSNKPVLINDTAIDPRWKALSNNPVRSWLGVPLRVRNEPVGVLNIDSHIVQRFTEDDIDLAEAFADQAGVAIQNARAHEFQIRVYETELVTARAIQENLMPQDKPPVPEVEIASRSIPARQVSGDYYQYYLLPDGKLGIAVGDVSGKGIPAALLMAVTTTIIREEILRTPYAAQLLNQLNDSLRERMRQNNMNTALLMSIFDPQTRQVEIANGGMVQPYYRNGSDWHEVEVGGYPLGAATRSTYSAKQITLSPGSMLVMVSDGVIESQDRKLEFFGFERLESLLNSLSKSLTAEEVTERIIEAVRQHLQGQEPQDDITVVTIQSLEA